VSNYDRTCAYRCWRRASRGVGGTNYPKLASQSDRRSLCGCQPMAGQEVEWFSHTRQGQAAIAYMLVTALATAKRWKIHDLIDTPASGYEDLVRLFVLANDTMPDA
jgi:hypothetical protein